MPYKNVFTNHGLTEPASPPSISVEFRGSMARLAVFFLLVGHVAGMDDNGQNFDVFLDEPETR